MTDNYATNLAFLERLLKKEENKLCADCRRKSPCWASTTFGSFICIKCSGFHRELGVHITKVKSVNLDKWKSEELHLYSQLNNQIVNNYFENKLKEHPGNKLYTDDYMLNRFIIDKYVERKWAKTKIDDPVSLLIQGRKLDEATIPEVEVEVEQQTSKKQESFPKFKKFEPTNENDKINYKNVINNTSNFSLIDLDKTEPQAKIAKTELLIDFPTTLKQPNQSSFSFINKNKTVSQPTSNLINLDSSENIKDIKFKETTNNIFKLFDDSTQSNVLQPNIFSKNYSPNLGTDLYNNNVSNITGNHNNSNGYPNYPLTYNLNSNLFVNDLFNKSNERIDASYSNQNTIKPIKANLNVEKNSDPFRDLVKFK